MADGAFIPPALGGPTLVVLDGGGGCDAMVTILPIQHATEVGVLAQMALFEGYELKVGR